MRMFDVDNGRILLNGNDATDLELKSLRQQISYVPQDGFLFSDTIENNIAFGAKQKDPEEVRRAAKMAVIHRDIEGFPKAYETEIGERGVMLSGGQKQRISIARAMIRDPQLVILDDSLSAVDTQTEHTIVDFLNKELAGKTSIMITHRVVGMLEFDMVLVLDEGKLVEQGTHEELIEKQGFYYDLWQQQLVSSMEEEDV